MEPQTCMYIFDYSTVNILSFKHQKLTGFVGLLQVVVDMIKTHFGEKPPANCPPLPIPDFPVPSHEEPRISCFVESEAAGVSISQK
jgi:hypothetical protein